MNWICIHTNPQYDSQCLRLGYIISSCTFCVEYETLHTCGNCRFFTNNICLYPVKKKEEPMIESC
ncbi:MAG TPA: hypothetical protein DCY75_04920 [Clostridiales bacterium]|nr:hypothetical protein [Clostridiales bacterium]